MAKSLRDWFFDKLESTGIVIITLGPFVLMAYFLPELIPWSFVLFGPIYGFVAPLFFLVIVVGGLLYIINRDYFFSPKNTEREEE